MPALGLGLGLPFARHPLAGGGMAAYDGLVATRARAPDQNFGSPFNYGMCRTGHAATEALTQIKVAWPNFGWFTGNEAGSGGTLTIISAAIEYPIGSGRQQLKFGGANSSSAAANDTIVVSDYLTLATTIPKDAVFRIWFLCNYSNGVMYRSYGADTATYGDQAALSTSLPTDVTLSGTMPASNIGAGYVPVCAVIGNTVNKSVIVVGDSIAWAAHGAGGQDREDVNGRIGIIAHGFAIDLPFLNLASSGSNSTDTLANSNGRKLLYQYCSHMVDETGINDVRGNTAVATITAAKTAIAAAFPARVKKYCTTIGPTNATSTDGFTTVGNQSIDSSHKTTADNFNAAVRAGISGFDGYFEIGDVISSARDSGKWALDPYTTHRTVTDAAITSGQSAVTSATANFTAADVGTAITINGAGAAGAALPGMISAVTNSTTATTTATASTTVSGATAFVGAITYDGLHPTPNGYQKVADAAVIVFP